MKNKCIDNICINNNIVKHRITEFITDVDIKEYFDDDVKVVTYSDLQKYDTIDQLLTKDKSCVILLIEWDQNIGHFVLLLKYIYNGQQVIEYFNSYGEPVSFEIKNMDKQKRIELDQTNLYLNKLFDKALSTHNIIYNKVQFQSYRSGVATCGRHAMFRCLMLQDFNLSLSSYITFMKKLKKKTNLSYDEIVAVFIE
jgi:hypothetical protein